MSHWIDRLRLIALAAGNNLHSPASDRSARYTMSAATRTAAHVGDEFVRRAHRRGLLKALGVFFGGLVLVAVLGVVLAAIFSLVVAVFVLLGGLVLCLVALALSPRWTRKAGAPQVLDVLRTPGGLAHLAEQTHGRRIAQGRLAAAQVIVKAAQAGDVADRRDAQLLALAQRTDDVEAPEEFIRRLDPDSHVYFPALPATLHGGGAADASRVKGALVLTTRYLFFLAGGIDLRPVDTASGGIAFDAATITRIESLSRAEHSLAISMRAITGLEMIEGEHPALVLRVDAAGGGPEWTVRWRLGDDRPEVEAGKIALWMVRIQLACAAEGNLLVWSESHPRLDHVPLPSAGEA